MVVNRSVLDYRKWLKSFGRTKGQGFKDKSLSELHNYQLHDISADTYHLEIGFGNGEHLLHKAQLNPHIQYIGAEVYLNGVGNLLRGIKTHNIKNISIWSHDVRLLLEKSSTPFISKAYILFPDPWPKRRTHKRRLINDQFLSLLLSKMQEGFEIIVASDIAEYMQWVEKTLINVDCSYTTEKPACMQNIQTKYQSKSIHPTNWLSITG